MKKVFLECGKIIAAHGVRGTVKVEPWCDSPEVFAALPAVYLKKENAFVPLRVKKASVFHRFVFAELEGVDSMEAADRLRNTVLYARRDDLGIEEGVMLVAEIVGLPVFDADSGASLGRVKDIIHPAANDIYVIQTPKGEAMVPAVPAFVKDVSEKGLFLTPIEGMFEA